MLNKTIAISFAQKFLSLSCAAISTIFLTTLLSPKDLGYYYTYISLLNGQILFELGFNYAATQLIAHEKAKLIWTKNKNLIGNKKIFNRYVSIFLFSIKLNTIIALVFCALAIIGGLFFFQINSLKLFHIFGIPWILVVASTTTKMVITGFECLLEGSDQVSEVAKTRLINNIIYYTIFWILLFRGYGLLSFGLASIMGIIYPILYYKKKYAGLFSDIINFIRKSRYKNELNWRTEILPFQWKLGLSWLSGFFLYHFMTPFVFKKASAEEAGTLGLVLSLVGATSSLTSAWTITQVPNVCALISAHASNQAFIFFKKMFISSMIASLTFSGFCIIFVHGLGFFNNKIHLILQDKWLLPAFLFSVILNQYTAVVAIFDRAQKTDSFYIVSLLSAILSVGLLYTLFPLYRLYSCALAFILPVIFLGTPFAIGLQAQFHKRGIFS